MSVFKSDVLKYLFINQLQIVNIANIVNMTTNYVIYLTIYTNYISSQLFFHTYSRVFSLLRTRMSIIAAKLLSIRSYVHFVDYVEISLLFAECWQVYFFSVPNSFVFFFRIFYAIQLVLVHSKSMLIRSSHFYLVNFKKMYEKYYLYRLQYYTYDFIHFYNYLLILKLKLYNLSKNK